MAIKHGTTKIPGQTLAAVADWNANHTGTATPDAHTHAGGDVTTAVASATNADTVDTKHAADFADSAAYGAHDHSAADPTQVSHANLTNVSSDQHHARQHAITGTSDHTSAATSGKMLKADASGLPIDATNTDADVSDAVTKKHAPNADTALGSGCEAADHGAAATDQVVNVCYGTGAPPAANTTTEGTIYLTYTV